MREVPLAEARLERLQKEIVPLRQTPPMSTVSDLEAEVQRLRSQLAQMEVTATLRRWPSPTAKFNPSSRFVECERVATRSVGVSEPIPIDPQDLQFWMSDKHLELRDAIEFGDQDSIFSLTDLIHRGAAQNQTLPSMVTNVDSA